MTKQQLRETIRKIIKQTLAENQPATAPSKPKTEPAVAPGKPSTDKPKPRRPLGNPDIAKDPDQRPKPKAIKATMTEAEMLAKIIKRFKSKKLKEETSNQITSPSTKTVEDAIKSGKIKPEEVKAAAEKAMKGDSTDLALLMAFGK